MASRLTKLLGPKGVAVCDGAMGTMLYARGVFINRSFDELNLSQPDLVAQIHKEYVQAGADVVETNTFGANKFKLAAHGLEGLVSQVNSEGARIARGAVGDNVLVAGAMGPLGVRIEPWGPVSVEEAREAFKEQAKALIDGGVNLLILETFYHLPELREAVLAIRELSTEIPLVASVTVTEEGSTPEGIEPDAFTRTISEWDVDAIGVNCSVGPVAALEAIEEMRAATELPLAAMPNAGAPRNVHGRNIYMSSPDYMASYARRFVKAGVRLVGGCCGTDPGHVRAMKEAVLAIRPEAGKRPPALTDAEVAKAAVTPVELAGKSRLGQALAAGEFAVCAQVRPPRGPRTQRAVNRARLLADGGVGCISVPEAGGASRMPTFAAGLILERELEIEVLVEYACRHRTLLRMQSELIGAHALGLRNLLLVTGPPLTMGEHPDALADVEVDSIGLTNMVHRLNQGLDVGGNPLGEATSFLIGIKLDPYAVDLEHEIRRFEWKVGAGAEVAITPPVLDVEAFKRFLDEIAHCRIPVIASVPLLSDFRGAERLRRQVGPTGVPRPLLDRLRQAEAAGQEAQVGLEISMETARALREHVQGVQVVGKGGEEAALLQLAQAALQS
jgi:homocysteine S-methyltransferase